VYFHEGTVMHTVRLAWFLNNAREYTLHIFSHHVAFAVVTYPILWTFN